MDESSSSPIADFSTCHVGILAQLDRLSGLPALLDAARQARQIAGDTAAFFRDVVLEHHGQEESELFPAVLASAHKGEERDRVAAIVQRLTDEHRQIETAFKALQSGLKAAAKGADAALDAAAVSALVQRYQRHARFEEESFLPLSQAILGRDSNHLAALGMSLHLRHAVPSALQRFGSGV
ncbi:MAG: hemerythrin domain-containing protein [Rubrivivax sp.]